MDPSLITTATYARANTRGTGTICIFIINIQIHLISLFYISQIYNIIFVHVKIFHVYTGAGVSSVKYRSISPPFHFSRELSPLSLEIKKVYQTISRSSPSRRLAVGRITRTAAPTPARKEPPVRTMTAPSPASVRRTGLCPPPPELSANYIDLSERADTVRPLSTRPNFIFLRLQVFCFWLALPSSAL